MARQHIEFVEAFDIRARAIQTGGLAGASRRELSADEETGASTALVSLPGGWSGELGGSLRPVELFCLRGALEVDGVVLTHGGYAYLPPADVPRPARAEGESVVLIMVEPVAAAAPEPSVPLDMLNIREMQWEAVRDRLGDRPERAEGIVVKLLRIDPASGAWTWVSAVPPEWRAGYAEVHPTIEECLMLRGDCLLGTSGGMRPGSYFYRPGMIPHGPMYSHGGAMWFFRTSGGGLATQYVEVPGWEQIVNEYVGRLDFCAPAEQQDRGRTPGG